eukprot:765833-Hanusia_phi.AAC.1
MRLVCAQRVRDASDREILLPVAASGIIKSCLAGRAHWDDLTRQHEVFSSLAVYLLKLSQSSPSLAYVITSS